MLEHEEYTPEEEAQEFAERLEAAKDARRMTWAELSRRSGIRVTNVNLLRRGKNVPKLGTLRRLGQALGVPWWELVRP